MAEGPVDVEAAFEELQALGMWKALPEPSRKAWLAWINVDVVPYQRARAYEAGNRILDGQSLPPRCGAWQKIKAVVGALILSV